jgi:hypothetical protein
MFKPCFRRATESKTSDAQIGPHQNVRRNLDTARQPLVSMEFGPSPSRSIQHKGPRDTHTSSKPSTMLLTALGIAFPLQQFAATSSWLAVNSIRDYERVLGRH